MSEADYLVRLTGRYGGCFVEDDDGELHGLHHSIRDALLETGVIWRERDGKWRIHSKDTDIIETRRRDLACCDFCQARPVVWDAHCDDFDLNGSISVGGWATCAHCGRLVQERNREALHARVQHSNRHMGNSAWIDDWLRLFWKHYKGKVTPVQPRPFGH